MKGTFNVSILVNSISFFWAPWYIFPSKSAAFFPVLPIYIGVIIVILSLEGAKTLLKDSGNSEATIPRPPHFIKVAVSAVIIQALIVSSVGQSSLLRHCRRAKFCISAKMGLLTAPKDIMFFFLLKSFGKGL